MMKPAAWLACLLGVIAGCGHSSHPGVTPDAAPPCTGGALFATSPAVTSAGDTIGLEGTFSATATVTFPDGLEEPATVLGSGRATVVVPADASAGDMALCGGGPAPMPFQRVSFPLGLGSFAARYEQAGSAARDAVLFTARSIYAMAVIGASVYVIGGNTEQNGAVSSIERATIHADGSLGVFTVQPSLSLTFSRAGASATVIGNHLYVVGGRQGNTPFDSVEEAEIQPDGTLGAFAVSPDVHLVHARAQHASAIVGGYLYVFGGMGEGTAPTGQALASVERAPIAADGTLGTFEDVPGVTLTVPRVTMPAIVLGDYLYVISGSTSDTDNGSVERAPVAPDGTLGNFSAVPDVHLVIPRYAFGIWRDETSLYAVGGWGGTGSTTTALTSIERATIHPDGTLDAFQMTSSSLAVPRYGFSMIHAGNRVYAISGFGASSNAPASCEHASIDASGDLGPFTAASATLGSVREGEATLVSGDRVYLLGGRDSSGAVADVDAGMLHPDGSLDAIAPTGAPLTTARADLAAAVAWNFLYAVGGRDATGAPLATLERASLADDGTVGSFAAYDVASLVTARYGHSVVVVDDAMYVFGGRDATGTALASAERATINAGGSLGPFSTVSNVTLGTARSGQATLVIGDRIYAIGGTDTAGNALASIEVAGIYPDGTISTFYPMSTTSLVAPRSGASIAVIGDSVYVIGGTSGTSSLSSLERAHIQSDGTLGPFSPVTTVALGTPRARAGVVSSGNTVYVIGGASSGGNALATIEQSRLQ